MPKYTPPEWREDTPSTAILTAKNEKDVERISKRQDAEDFDFPSPQDSLNGSSANSFNRAGRTAPLSAPRMGDINSVENASLSSPRSKGRSPVNKRTTADRKTGGSSSATYHHKPYDTLTTPEYRRQRVTLITQIRDYWPDAPPRLLPSELEIVRGNNGFNVPDPHDYSTQLLQDLLELAQLTPNDHDMAYGELLDVYQRAHRGKKERRSIDANDINETLKRVKTIMRQHTVESDKTPKRNGSLDTPRSKGKEPRTIDSYFRTASPGHAATRQQADDAITIPDDDDVESETAQASSPQPSAGPSSASYQEVRTTTQALEAVVARATERIEEQIEYMYTRRPGREGNIKDYASHVIFGVVRDVKMEYGLEV